MQLPTHLIHDLLPLYLAEEVSMETKVMIDAYLQEDVSLAKTVERAKLIPHTADLIEPIAMDDEMKTFKNAQRKMLQSHLIAQSYIFLSLSVFFTIIWLLVRTDAFAFAVMIFSWLAVLRLHVQISNSVKD